MPDPLILSLEESRDRRLVGGKAAGLAKLIGAGFAVPRGFCVTTALYRHCLEASGIDAAEAWKKVRHSSEAQRIQEQARIRDVLLAQPWPAGFQADLNHQLTNVADDPWTRWAVRSSATNEDATEASAAGFYHTGLGLSQPEVLDAIRDCWISLWCAHVGPYLLRSGADMVCPAMAVVVQPMLDAKAAGVAYSIHPVTGRTSQVAINAVPGLASALVSGEVTPDQYVVEVEGVSAQPPRIRRRLVTRKLQKLVATTQGVRPEPIPTADEQQSSLSDEQLFELARLSKLIEAAFQQPVDVEWVWDTERLWVLQARPITAVRPLRTLTNDECEWTRANFKETMPELPSPLSISFLERFMDEYILAPYRRLGCTIPEGLSAVRVLRGRPYVNVTLFYSFVVQLYGNPAFLTEQMGGDRLTVTPPVRPLGPFALLRAGFIMLREWRRVARQAPLNFAIMKQMSERYRSDHIQHLSVRDLTETLNNLGQWLDDHEVTFGIVGGVAQSLQALGTFLPGWLGPDWRELLNASVQGQGNVISAQQLVRLAELVEVARREPVVQRWFLTEAWSAHRFRETLAGTEFLRLFERYLLDYGHRAVGESDVMSVRIAEQPEAILAVLQTQVRSHETAAPAEIVARQTKRRDAAIAEITQRFGRCRYRGMIFRWWYRRLCRFCALREANRHHLMYYSTAMRHLLLRLGERMVDQGAMAHREDIFFLTLDERTALGQSSQCDWRQLVRDRREEWARNEAVQVPDTIRDWDETADTQSDQLIGVEIDGDLRGIAISAGIASGPVRIVRLAADWKRVQAGDILVVPVIDPGMAPLFGVAAGLVAEMGGTLSHGAIIAREYGLPVLVNVPYATSLLRDEERVQITSSTGIIKRLVS